MLDFRVLTFLKICETMSFTKAAEELHITQPAVSQHIRYLEDFYGTKLFIYAGKKLHLTTAGELLYSTGITMRNDAVLLKEQMEQRMEMKIPLRFGVTMTIGEFWVAKPLGAYLKRHTAAQVCMEMGNTSMLVDRLRSGQLHFALVEGYFDRTEFDAMPYSSEPFTAVCSARHVFSKKPRQLSDLCSERC